MRKQARKKKIVKLLSCSECNKQFDIDELKIFWREYRLVCPACLASINENSVTPVRPKGRRP